MEKSLKLRDITEVRKNKFNTENIPTSSSNEQVTFYKYL